MKVFSGRAAGICYAPEDYLDNAIHDSLKAKNRADFNAKSGHYSVFEHGHVSFIIQCSKAIAMILNSTRLYATSEKSARYTFMKAETILENQMYQKWKAIFTRLIAAYYDTILNEKDIEKLTKQWEEFQKDMFVDAISDVAIDTSPIKGMAVTMKNVGRDIKDGYRGTTTTRLQDEDIYKIANAFYEVIKEVPIENKVVFDVKEGDVNIDGERVGRRLEPIISRIQATS